MQVSLQASNNAIKLVLNGVLAYMHFLWAYVCTESPLAKMAGCIANCTYLVKYTNGHILLKLIHQLAKRQQIPKRH